MNVDTDDLSELKNNLQGPTFTRIYNPLKVRQKIEILININNQN